MSSVEIVGKRRTAKFVAGLFGVLTLATGGLMAQSSVSLAWDPAAGVSGYRLYSGTTTRKYSSVQEIGSATSVQVTNLSPGVTYFFALTSYDSLGMESVFSSELPYTVYVGRPAPITLNIQIPPTRRTIITGSATASLSYDVLATQDLKTWTSLGVVTADVNGAFSFTDNSAPNYSQRYYKLRGR